MPRIPWQLRIMIIEVSPAFNKPSGIFLEDRVKNGSVMQLKNEISKNSQQADPSTVVTMPLDSPRGKKKHENRNNGQPSKQKERGGTGE